MPPLAKTHALYADLARTLGVTELVPDAHGGIELSVGSDATVVLYGTNDVDLLVVAPVAALPSEPGYALASWLLKRNFYDSDLLPFRLACDKQSNVILWGRVPLEGQTGERLSGLINVVATQAGRIRTEMTGEGE